jgi:hypothetical protein
VDKKAVWELVSSLCRDQDCWTHVKPFLKKKDGRGAYRALYDYYLGKQNVDNQATSAEKAIELATWSQNSKRYTFDSFVKIHLDNHQILLDLTEHGYAGIDEHSKVRHLLQGIKSTKMDSVKTAILASDTLRSDFGACVSLYKDFMTQNEGLAGGDNRNISQLSIRGGGGGGGGGGKSKGKGKGKGRSKRTRDDALEDVASVPCDDRYYTKEEYKGLSVGNKKWLMEKRDNRVASGGGKDNRSNANKRLRTSEAALSILTTAVDALQVKGAEAQDAIIAHVETNAGSELPTNSTNSALTRTATRQLKK